MASFISPPSHPSTISTADERLPRREPRHSQQHHRPKSVPNIASLRPPYLLPASRHEDLFLSLATAQLSARPSPTHVYRQAPVTLRPSTPSSSHPQEHAATADDVNRTSNGSSRDADRSAGVLSAKEDALDVVGTPALVDGGINKDPAVAAVAGVDGAVAWCKAVSGGEASGIEQQGGYGSNGSNLQQGLVTFRSDSTGQALPPAPVLNAASSPAPYEPPQDFGGSDDEFFDGDDIWNLDLSAMDVGAAGSPATSPPFPPARLAANPTPLPPSAPANPASAAPTSTSPSATRPISTKTFLPAKLPAPQHTKPPTAAPHPLPSSTTTSPPQTSPSKPPQTPVETPKRPPDSKLAIAGRWSPVSARRGVTGGVSNGISWTLLPPGTAEEQQAQWTYGGTVQEGQAVYDRLLRRHKEQGEYHFAFGTLAEFLARWSRFPSFLHDGLSTRPSCRSPYDQQLLDCDNLFKLWQFVYIVALRLSVSAAFAIAPILRRRAPTSKAPFTLTQMAIHFEQAAAEAQAAGLTAMPGLQAPYTGWGAGDRAGVNGHPRFLDHLFLPDSVEGELLRAVRELQQGEIGTDGAMVILSVISSVADLDLSVPLAMGLEVDVAVGIGSVPSNGSPQHNSCGRVSPRALRLWAASIPVEEQNRSFSTEWLPGPSSMLYQAMDGVGKKRWSTAADLIKVKDDAEQEAGLQNQKRKLEYEAGAAIPRVRGYGVSPAAVAAEKKREAERRERERVGRAKRANPFSVVVRTVKVSVPIGNMPASQLAASSPYSAAALSSSSQALALSAHSPSFGTAKKPHLPPSSATPGSADTSTAVGALQKKRKKAGFARAVEAESALGELEHEGSTADEEEGPSTKKARLRGGSSAEVSRKDEDSARGSTAVLSEDRQGEKRGRDEDDADEASMTIDDASDSDLDSTDPSSCNSLDRRIPPNTSSQSPSSSPLPNTKKPAAPHPKRPKLHAAVTNNAPQVGSSTFVDLPENRRNTASALAIATESEGETESDVDSEAASNEEQATLQLPEGSVKRDILRANLEVVKAALKDHGGNFSAAAKGLNEKLDRRDLVSIWEQLEPLINWVSVRFYGEQVKEIETPVYLTCAELTKVLWQREPQRDQKNKPFWQGVAQHAGIRDASGFGSQYGFDSKSPPTSPTLLRTYRYAVNKGYITRAMINTAVQRFQGSPAEKQTFRIKGYLIVCWLVAVEDDELLYLKPSGKHWRLDENLEEIEAKPAAAANLKPLLDLSLL